VSGTDDGPLLGAPVLQPRKVCSQLLGSCKMLEDDLLGERQAALYFWSVYYVPLRVQGVVSEREVALSYSNFSSLYDARSFESRNNIL
jgi:hypothetical protein